ncbi:hypothetical protein MmiHf6_15230 [Methanimicrococcus hongohii]|uniref:Uncharacterized protein n=1 Tax=Methanimicrococcus hongohii TaxID=3028295 RepID=A0AA96V0Q5_9EURY|nr:hypothetical protein [Methanimicrococcus sp. Hf6]WNY24194.1 hypothetical protein MmiHf6_15230 [Methanimicrococcus sp. Hf6]
MELDEINYKIDILKNEIESLEKESEKIKNEQTNKEINENTSRYLSEIYNITDENSYKVRLYNDTKTTPIMDKFNEKYEYLLIGPYYSLKDFLKYSLVIMKRPQYKVNFTNSSLTMTKLKQCNWGPLNSLISETLNANENPQKVLPFKIPYSLGGQTSRNQTGYGSEYHYGELYIQGTLYGEVTNFYIIGLIFD